VLRLWVLGGDVHRLLLLLWEPVTGVTAQHDRRALNPSTLLVVVVVFTLAGIAVPTALATDGMLAAIAAVVAITSGTLGARTD
jgi:hypothetical protein